MNSARRRKTPNQELRPWKIVKASSKGVSDRSRSTRTVIRTQHPAYPQWRRMMSRCTNPKDPQYRDYGAVGITVHKELADFEKFLEHVGAPQPPDNIYLMIGDPCLGYAPGNVYWGCRQWWVRRRRSARLYKCRGQTLTLTEWSIKLGVQPQTILYRMKSGWSVEEALTTPKGAKRCNIIEMDSW